MDVQAANTSRTFDPNDVGYQSRADQQVVFRGEMIEDARLRYPGFLGNPDDGHVAIPGLVDNLQYG